MAALKDASRDSDRLPMLGEASMLFTSSSLHRATKRHSTRLRAGKGCWPGRRAVKIQEQR